MSEFGDSLKATARTAIGQVLGVTKAAGTTANDTVYLGVIDLLCDHLGKVYDRIGESNKVLQAIYRGDEPGPPRLVEMDANQWSVTLSPDVPPHRMNGFDNGRRGGHDLQE